MLKILPINQTGINRAVDTIAAGQVVAMQVLGIYGLFADAANKKAVEELQKIKGERGKTFSVIMHVEDALMFADTENVEEATLKVLYDAKKRAGGRTHIRIPVQEKYLRNVPVAVYSTEDGLALMQFLDPTGIQSLTMLVDELNARGINFLAASSMNTKNQSVITDMNSATEFCRKHGVNLLLTSNTASNAVEGDSFPIVSFVKNGSGRALGVRRGRRDYADVLHEALGVEIDWQ